MISIYTPVFVYLAASCRLSAVILGLSYILGNQAPDVEKSSSYECGFESFGDSRSPFDVRFYLVSILFIVFDLETMFLFPWSIVLGDLGALGYWTMIDFIVELLVGYLYVWKIGALEWS